MEKEDYSYSPENLKWYAGVYGMVHGSLVSYKLSILSFVV